MRARLAVAASAAVLLAQLIRIAYLAPGSLGAHEIRFDGFAIALVVLTTANFAGALLTCVSDLPRSRRGLRNVMAAPEAIADLAFRVSDLMSRPWKAFITMAFALAISAVAYGFYDLHNVYDESGHYYRDGHAHLVPISHDQYVTATHQPLIAAAGVETAVQAAAVLLTFLAVDRLSSRGNWAIWTDPFEPADAQGLTRRHPAVPKSRGSLRDLDA